MAYKNTIISYGSVSKFLHWLIFLMITSLLIVGFTMGGISDKALKGQVINVHKIIGSCVLLIMLFRVFWTLINIKPKLPDRTPRVQAFLSHIVHFTLYFLLIFIPISGAIMSSAAGYSTNFGFFSLSLPIAKNKAVSDLFGEIHQILAWVIICVLTLHILAALKHHYINRDSILVRMLPRMKYKSKI
jgi:cytochrome b561